MNGREESEHLAGLSDGAGCTEIWEHLSERRTEEAESAAESESEADAGKGDRDEADDVSLCERRP